MSRSVFFLCKAYPRYSCQCQGLYSFSVKLTHATLVSVEVCILSLESLPTLLLSVSRSVFFLWKAYPRYSCPCRGLYSFSGKLTHATLVSVEVCILSLESLPTLLLSVSRSVFFLWKAYPRYSCQCQGLYSFSVKKAFFHISYSGLLQEKIITDEICYKVWDCEGLSTAIQKPAITADWQEIARCSQQDYCPYTQTTVHTHRLLSIHTDYCPHTQSDAPKNDRCQ